MISTLPDISDYFKELRMSIRVTFTPKLQAQFGSGVNCMDLLKIINYQAAEALGGEPTAWSWRPWGMAGKECIVLEGTR